MRRLALIIAAAGTVALTLSAPATARPAPAAGAGTGAITGMARSTVTVPAPAGSRRCTAGVIDYGYHYSAPSWVSEDWESNGCFQQINPKEVDIQGIVHYGGWVAKVEYTTTASSSVTAADLIIRYRDGGAGTQKHCREVWPQLASGWSNC
jgi:hypothetical protein